MNLDAMRVTGLAWLGIPAGDYAAGPVLRRDPGPRSCLRYGTPWNLPPGTATGSKLVGAGRRYFEFYRSHGDSTVPRLEVDDLDQARPSWPAAAPSYSASRSQTAPGPGSPSGRPAGTSTAWAPATSLQHARPPAPRTSQVFAGDQPTPAPAADPFSLADPATAGATLATSGFTAVKITGVHEPVYYGPDAASALRGMLSLQMTKALLAPLDAASTRHALSQLRAALANHHSSGGVFFDSYAWLITARRPDTLTPQRASSTRTPPPCRPAGQPAI